MLLLCPLSSYHQELRVWYKRRHDRELIFANALLAFTARDGYSVLFFFSGHLSRALMVLLTILLGLHDCFMVRLKSLGSWSQSPWPLLCPKVLVGRLWEPWRRTRGVHLHEFVFVRLQDTMWLAEEVPHATWPQGAALSPARWNRALPLWSQVADMLPCAHPCLLWHISRRSCSLSVVQEVYSLLLGALEAKRFNQQSEGLGNVCCHQLWWLHLR